MPETALSKLDFTAARFHMVECQVRPNKVRDGRVLDALESVPREIFVPSALAGIAYIDEDLPVGQGRFMLEPMIIARMLEALELKAEDRVLEIGCATGYSTALLAMLTADVVAVESDGELQQRAIANLNALGLKNTEVRNVSLTQGWKTKAPYTVIFVNGAVEELPQSLLAQLEEGGRLVAVIRNYGAGKLPHTGEARLYEKIRGTVSSRGLFDANVKLLPGFEIAQTFKF